MSALFGNFVVILILVVIVALAVRSIWKTRKNGCHCGGDCSCCGGCGSDKKDTHTL